MPREPGLTYVKKEPSFLRKFKEETGYVEHDVTDKQAKLDKEKRPVDRAEEEPQVVQLTSEHLSAEEAKSFLKEQKKQDEDEGTESAAVLAEIEEEEEPPADGKIRFKKPKKREGNELGLHKSKKAKIEGKTNEKKKGVKNKTLLSFGDGEDDE
eukprot:sb/3473264/